MRHDFPDHPVIRNLERTGFPDGKIPDVPICPECKKDADTYYKTISGEIIGCDNCITAVDAWEVADRYDEHEEVSSYG